MKQEITDKQIKQMVKRAEAVERREIILRNKKCTCGHGSSVTVAHEEWCARNGGSSK